MAVAIVPRLADKKENIEIDDKNSISSTTQKIADHSNALLLPSHALSSIEATEISRMDLDPYLGIMCEWFQNISDINQRRSSFDEQDQQIILDSIDVISVLCKCLSDEQERIIGETNCELLQNFRFFAALNSCSKKVHAFGIAKIDSINEGELLFLAADPQNLPLKDRLNSRVRGSGSTIVQFIAAKTNRLFVVPESFF